MDPGVGPRPPPPPRLVVYFLTISLLTTPA
jgi:hypothetical protein